MLTAQIIMYKKPDIRLTSLQVMSIALDLLTIAAAFAAATLIRKALGGEFPVSRYYRLWPFLPVFSDALQHHI